MYFNTLTIHHVPNLFLLLPGDNVWLFFVYVWEECQLHGVKQLLYAPTTPGTQQELKTIAELLRAWWQ